MHGRPCVQGAAEGEPDFGGAWEVLGSSTVHAAHYLGFVLVPLVVFLVGVSEYDLLHAGYLAQLLVYFLSSTARLEPPLETAVVPLRKVPWSDDPPWLWCRHCHSMANLVRMFRIAYHAVHSARGVVCFK